MAIAVLAFLQSQKYAKTAASFRKELSAKGIDVGGKVVLRKLTWEAVESHESSGSEDSNEAKPEEKIEMHRATQRAGDRDSSESSDSSSSSSEEDEASTKTPASKRQAPGKKSIGTSSSSSSDSESSTDDSKSTVKKPDSLAKSQPEKASDKSSSESVSSSSNDSESSDDDDAPRISKKIAVTAKKAKGKAGSSLKETADSSTKSKRRTKTEIAISKSSDVDTSSSSEDEVPPPTKKVRLEAKAGVVSPEDSDSNVSDVEVSDVSSVEVSSSDGSDSDSSSSDEESEDENDIQERIKLKRRDAAKKAQEAAKAAHEWRPSAEKKKVEIKAAAGTDGAQALSKGKPFQRVDSEFWGRVAVKDGGAMADNSYEGLFGDNGYGAQSSAKLLTVRGKNFTKEKNKRKRSFNGLSRTGGQIDTERSYSTKYQYSDDE
jgi:hypothetical protein